MPIKKGVNAMRNYAIPGARCDEALYQAVLEESKSAGQAHIIRNAILLYMRELPDNYDDVSPEPEQGAMTRKLQNTYLFPDDYPVAKKHAANLGGMSSFMRRALYYYFNYNEEKNK